jgi:hypothetical protein
MAFHLLAAPLCVFSFSTTGVVENESICIGDLAKARADRMDLESAVSMVRAACVTSLMEAAPCDVFKTSSEALKRLKPKSESVDRCFQFLLHVIFQLEPGANQCDHSQFGELPDVLNSVSFCVRTGFHDVFTYTLIMSVSSVSPSFSAAHRYVEHALSRRNSD